MLRKISTSTLLLLSGFFSLTLLLGSCSSDDPDPEDPTDDVSMTDDDPNPDPDPEPENKSTGFVIVGTTSSETALATYVEEIPSGTVDLSVGTDYAQFFPTAAFDNALYMARTDGSAGFSKIVVNEDGELEEEGVIPTIDAGSFRIAVRDATTGVFQDRATPNTISVFNPETLEVTANIDMSAGFVPGDIDQRYQRFIFRGNDVFAPIRGNDGQVFTSFILHQANLETNSFVGDTQRDGNGVSEIVTFNNFGQNLTDAMGNLYVSDAGNYSGEGIAARINKIPAGSNEIDPDYIFEPAVVLNPTNVFLPTFNGFNVVDDNIAIARVNAETPQEAIDIVLAAGGLQNLTDDQIQQILGILFTAESARWCAIDLNELTVTPIEGIPAVGAFSGGNTFSANGEVYIPVTTTSENAYYRWSSSSTSATKAFDVTGADISGVFNIANNN